MRVLHIASFNRWTGAAAPAFAEAAALRSAGVETDFFYIGGHNLEERLGELPWAHPVVESRGIGGPLRTLRRLRTFVRDHGVDLIHSHLTNDHIVAALAAREGTRVVRTIHSPRALRSDPGTRLLASRTDGFCAVNPALLDHSLPRSRPHALTPPPLDTSEFHPAGPDARSELGVPDHEPLIGFIGKVAPGRGFETAIETLVAVRRRHPAARLMIIGKGPHRPFLESLASDLGIADALIWTGYQDRELATFYRAADVMLFTAAGSDHGHRAILEEMGCGTPVVACPLPGVSELMGPLSHLIAAGCDAEALADRVNAVVSAGKLSFRELLRTQSARFDFASSARRLIEFYDSL